MTSSKMLCIENNYILQAMMNIINVIPINVVNILIEQDKVFDL